MLGPVLNRLLEESSPAATVIREEHEILARVHLAIERRAPASLAPQPNAYDAELLELRDALAEAKPEDIPPLVEQMARVAALAASRRRDEKLPVDPASPYFAHLRLREPVRGAPSRERTRDVLIGRRGFIDRASRVQIVDWRDAPVSQIYYRYDEGDDYDEHLDGRHLEGVVEARRNVTIAGGALRRIGCPLGTYVADGDGRWLEAEGGALPTLSGGQGKAARPPRPRPAPRGMRARSLGVHSGPVPRADKHLPEIAALIDPEQFDLITAPSSGLVVIQGGAGSGKTTVALHRVAYLVFQGQEGQRSAGATPRSARPVEAPRFRPSRCLVVVPSVALERYVAGVLPALGVRGVPVVTFAGWARGTRRKVFPWLPDRYNEETPAAVARVKKHPALLAVLARFVAERTAEAGAEIVHACSSAEARAAIGWAWEDFRDRPPLPRVAALARWLGERAHEPLDPAERQRAELAITRVRRRLRDVRTAWAELLTDRRRLHDGLPATGPDAVSDAELDETVEWVAAQNDEGAAEELAGIDPEARAPVDGGLLDDSAQGRASGRLDREDDPLFLRLAQLLRGALYHHRGPGSHDGDGALIEYDHIAIDEAQDYSAIGIQVLLEAAADHRAGDAPPGSTPLRSVTLAGDVAQRLVFDNGFRGWRELLADVGLRDATIRPLHLSYRSTEEVMRFSRQVLGPLASADEEPAARSGAPVELHRFAAMGEAVAFLAESLRSLAGREPTASVALIARYPAQADAYYSALGRAEVPSLRRVQRQDFAFAPGVDVTDVAQVKGLEFDYVVLLDATSGNYPDAVEARHLLHIGATRAAHQLWLITVGTPSPLLPEDLY
jgi:DNA helicase-2/ATP-dependent DNA helicase PcrA